MSAPPDPRQRWIFGPVPDLVFGAGLFYVFLFAAMAVAGDDFRRVLPVGIIPLLALFTSMPHFGATLLRTYERREDRRKYAFFAVYVSAAVWIAFAIGVHDVFVGSILFTIYLTFGPWHYTGQNYGITLVFLRRRGVDVDPGLKRWLYASFVLSFALTVIALHGRGGAAYQPIWDEDTVYRLLSLRIPPPAAAGMLGVAGAAYLLALAETGRRLLRRASPRTLLPAALLIGSQALWFTIPLGVRHLGWLGGVDPLSVEHSVYAFLWVAIAHSLQYTWITCYYEKRSERPRPLPVYWLQTLLAGAALWGIPALLFAPGALGRMPFDRGLELMVVVAVNIQHFLLDGAIWKLRDGRVARALLRSGDPPLPGPVDPRRGLSLRPAFWAAGAVALAALLVGAVEREFGVRRALERSDLERAEAAVERLRWVGRDSADVRMLLAQERAREGEFERALEHAERGLALRGDWRGANNVAWRLATHPRTDPALAPRVLELAHRASETVDHDHPVVLDTLAAAYANHGEFDQARHAARKALYRARRDGPADLAPAIERRLELYKRERPYREAPQAEDAVAARRPG